MVGGGGGGWTGEKNKNGDDVGKQMKTDMWGKKMKKKGSKTPKNGVKTA